MGALGEGQGWAAHNGDWIAVAELQCEQETDMLSFFPSASLLFLLLCFPVSAAVSFSPFFVDFWKPKDGFSADGMRDWGIGNSLCN